MKSRGTEQPEWISRPVRGRDAGKVYRCPGCDHEIPIGQPHVVAWPVGWYEGADARRHWHTPCWRAGGAAPQRWQPNRTPRHR